MSTIKKELRKANLQIANIADFFNATNVYKTVEYKKKFTAKFTDIFSLANSKLKPDGIACWNLPAFESCLFKNNCKRSKDDFTDIENDFVCYALKGNYMRYPAIRGRQFLNWEFSKSEQFVDMVSTAINKYKGKFKIHRIHDAGDFYSLAYLQKWIQIAMNCPDRQFYAYTKAIKLVDWDLLPANFKIIQSQGGIHDSEIDYTKPHTAYFQNVEDLLKAVYTDCSKSDLQASQPDVVKVGLVYH